MSLKLKEKQSKERGSSILYVTLLVGALLVVVLGISGILIYQIKITSGIGYSVVAFYAADSGIENLLLNRNNPSDKTVNLQNNATYKIFVLGGGEDGCSAELNYCVRSLGSYMGVKRAIEIGY